MYYLRQGWRCKIAKGKPFEGFGCQGNGIATPAAAGTLVFVTCSNAAGGQLQKASLLKGLVAMATPSPQLACSTHQQTKPLRYIHSRSLSRTRSPAAQLAHSTGQQSQSLLYALSHARPLPYLLVRPDGKLSQSGTRSHDPTRARPRPYLLARGHTCSFDLTANTANPVHALTIPHVLARGHTCSFDLTAHTANLVRALTIPHVLARGHTYSPVAIVARST